MDIPGLSIDMARSASDAAKILFPLALGAAAAEFALIALTRRLPYSLRQAGLSLLMGLGYARAAALAGVFWGWLYFVCYEHRLFTLAMDAWWQPLLLFVAVDFCYYWQHRFAHRTRWGWASHIQHHSVEQLNMAAPFRLSVTSALSGFQAFYAPLGLLGFHPSVIVVFVLLNVTLQVFAHTETVRKLGVLEKVLNTPSHHRVHHASNPIYLDKNLGGMFIVWDKWFGTFQPELDEVKPVYGLVNPLRETRYLRLLLQLWFKEWLEMVRDIWSAAQWRDKWRHAFNPPGWMPGRS